MKTVGVVAGLAVLMAARVLLADQLSGPVGVWRTFSDVDGHETGKVEISEQGGVLYGNVIDILDPAKRVAVCRKCEDDRRGQKVLGMQIIRGLKPDGARWGGGQILDPENGSTYRCILRVTENGRKLVVRGFIGLALLGRSQTWVRVQ